MLDSLMMISCNGPEGDDLSLEFLNEIIDYWWNNNNLRLFDEQN